MNWRIPFSSTGGVAHLFRNDRAFDSVLCTGLYVNVGLASDGSDAPRCMKCLKMADARDRRLALQESWSLPA